MVTGNEFHMNNGTILVNVHDKKQCAGRRCVVHNPTQHHMSMWPAEWDDAMGMVMRVCPHGWGHPDPDDRWFRTTRSSFLACTHQCDSCCQPEEILGDPWKPKWPHAWRSSIDDCNDNRCPKTDPDGRCHMRPGHPGECDSSGASHWEAPQFKADHVP